MDQTLFMKYMEYCAFCKLGTKDYKVLLFIIGYIIDGQKIKFNQNKISSEIGISKSDVSVAFKNLGENKILQFDTISPRRRLTSLVKYTEEELDDLIVDKVESNIEKKLLHKEE